MAICTYHFTLLYFRQESLPGPPLAQKVRHVAVFGTSNVVELQNHDIGLTAINAGMVKQVPI